MAFEINSKAEKVYEIIEEANDKVIIFTEYRATQDLFTMVFKFERHHKCAL